MNIALKILTLCLYLLLVFPSVSARNYTFRSLSVSDGLPDLVVNSIYKDSRGFVWMGTNVSLERFDGVRLKHYFVEGAGEKRQRVYAVAETEEGEIWAGTDMGLFRVDGKRNCLERMVPDLIDTRVHALCMSGDTAYIGTDRGLYVCIGGNFRNVLPDKNIFSQSNRVTGIACGSDGIVWLSTMGGLKSVCPEDWKANGFPFRTEEGSVETKAFYNISLVGGRIFLGTMTDGIVEFNPQTATFRPYVDVGCSVISSLSTDGKDRLYVGTDGNGVHFISVSEGKIVRSFRHEPRDKTTIRSNSVYSVLVDREGLLWIGFYQLGVDYSICRNSLFHVYRYGTTFTTEDIPVRTVAFHGNQRLIGSRDGFVFIDEAAGQFKVFKASQLRAGIILSSCYFEGNFYIGTYGGGMYVLNPHTLELEDFNPGDSYPFRSGHIFCIRPDADGCLWVGTSDGVYCFRNGKKIRHLTSAGTKLPDGNVYEIFFDSSLKGWICTENGLCIWDPSTNSLKTNVFPEGFVDKEKIRMVYETSDRKLLFLPEKGELFVSDLSLRNYGYVERGTLLSGKNLMSVVEDDGGALWITTNNGIYRYAKEEGIIPFGIADGVPSSIFINCYAVKDETGTLWFGNSRGLVYLPGGDVHSLPHSPYPMAVSELLVDGLERPDLLERSGTHYVLSLDASIRSVTVQLPDGVFTYPGGAIYEYRREGESGWTPVMGGAEICFSGLSGKDCRYYVRRAGFPDSVMTLDMHFPFTRFWLWAGLSAVLLVLGGSVLIYRKKNLRPSQSVSSEDVSGEAFSVPSVAESGEDETEPAVALPEEVEVAEHPVEVQRKSAVEDKYRTNKLSEEECARLYGLLEHVMHERKPYTSPDLKIADLAAMVGSTSHGLSYLFNQYLHKSYYDYVNEFRIGEFKEIVTREDCSRYTLEALAELCGFSSRASFFRSFKKVTGITPNEYIKSVQK